VDPATATDASHYSVSCAGVTSAMMLDPRSVLLTLDGPVAGADCLVSVSGVVDLASPANTIAAGTQAAVFQALGAITRREYRHIPYGQVVDLVNHPRFPNSPSVIDYLAQFESPSNVGENFGAQLLGYVHPPVTGDYVFHLSADETAELYLSMDDQPRNKQLIARERQPHYFPREWMGGSPRKVEVAPEQVLVPGAFFIEAEDFNHGGGLHEAAVDAMPYDVGAYAGLAAVAEIDFHDDDRNDNPTPQYRAPAFRSR
jgi:hypothetical protein